MNIFSLKCKRVRESCVSATPDYLTLLIRLKKYLYYLFLHQTFISSFPHHFLQNPLCSLRSKFHRRSKINFPVSYSRL